MRAISTYLRRLRLAVTLLCVTPVIGFAQDYRPDILELSPGEGLSVPWDKALDLSGGGTVEFWVVPTFEGVPNYDPVILSSAGPNGAPYLIAMLRDKDGIAVVAGEEEGVIPYEFTDGKLHHVAVNSYADGIIVYIGGSAAASFDFTVPEIPSSGLFIGSGDGEAAAFTGAIAGLRFWRTPIVEEYLLEFQLKPALSEEENHPDIEFLSAVSDFANEQILIVEEISQE